MMQIDTDGPAVVELELGVVGQDLSLRTARVLYLEPPSARVDYRQYETSRMTNAPRFLGHGTSYLNAAIGSEDARIKRDGAVVVQRVLAVLPDECGCAAMRL